MPDTPHPQAEQASPHTFLLHYSILLAGFGTVFLGPLLPTLTALLHTGDGGGGALLAAQFSGAFLGGWSTSSRLWLCMVRGYAAALLGFAALGWQTLHTPRTFLVLPALLLLGFGIGGIITSVNLLASRKWRNGRGAALTLLNFTWSFGALTAPLLLPSLVRRFGAAPVLAGMAALLLAGLVPAAATWPRNRLGIGNTTPPSFQTGSGTREAGLPTSSYLYFCALLFLYGGVETSLGGWLTTFDLRYGNGSHHAFALSTTVFWSSLTIARAVSPAILRHRLPEKFLLRIGLTVAVAALLAMSSVHGGSAIAACAAVVGLSLSPWFPLVLSQMIGESATAKQAGRVIAISGLGAAAIPWLVGQISASTGSLRIGLVLPIAGAVVLLALSFRPSPSAQF